MKKLALILALIVCASMAFAVKPEKKKERDSKKDYMVAKAEYIANPTQGKYQQMMTARLAMATEVIKWRKERKNK